MEASYKGKIVAQFYTGFETSKSQAYVVDKRCVLSVLGHRNDHILGHNKSYMKTCFWSKEK